MLQYTVITTDDHLWELPKLIDFLVKNQGKDIVLNTNPEAHDLNASGLYDILDKFSFKSVTIKTWNLLESHSKYHIEYKDPTLFFFREKYWQHWEVSPALHKWNKKKLFGVFYGRPTADRLGIASHLWCNHKKQTEFVLAFDPSDQNYRHLFEISKMYEYHRQGIINFSHLESHLPLKPAGVEYENLIYKKKNPVMFDLYKNILIDIISEPNIKGSPFFLTEKTVRAILMKKPFIIMGPERSNAYLKQMGFKTFGNFWDEDYDGYSGQKRYVRILALIDTLAKNNNFETIYNNMQPMLEYNYQRLIQQSYKTKITKI
jgi:hypothetical protein